jgi:GDP-4-dehydro-6-deoxy-D-mannose reductase
MKKILITGVTGFAGSFLAEELLKNPDNQIIGTYHSSPNLEELPFLSSVLLEQGDITSAEHVEALVEKYKPEEIYHLAAATSPGDSFKDPKATLEANIMGELNILEAVKKLGLKETKVLLVISAEVYGKVSTENLPITEDVPFMPMNPYGVSKVAQDYLGLQYHLSDNLQIIRVRPFNHIGPRQTPKFVVASFAKQLAEIEKSSDAKGVLKVGNLDAIRDFSDVRDIVKGYILLMEKGAIGDVYNMGSEKEIRISDMLDTLKSFVKKEVEVIQDPSLIRPVDVPELVCSATKIKNLGWSPAISLEQSLKDTLEYWRKRV